MKVEKAEYDRLTTRQKDQAVDDALEFKTPDNDGIDHEKWPIPARKLALLMLDPEFSTDDKRLGAECGYSLRSVKRYKQDPDFISYVNQVSKRVYFDETFWMMVLAIRKGLMSSKPSRYIELYMKSLGMLKEVRTVEGTVNVNENKTLTLVDLRTELEQLRKEAGIDESDDSGGGTLVN